MVVTTAIMSYEYENEINAFPIDFDLVKLYEISKTNPTPAEVSKKYFATTEHYFVADNLTSFSVSVR